MKNFGELKAIVKDGEPGGPCVVLFHGYGADAFDLEPLSGALYSPKGTTWVFPNGVQSVLIAPGFTGRAWFQIDLEAYERAIVSGQHRDLSNEQPPGFEHARKLALGLVEYLQTRHSKVVVGGFSQGAMLATDVAFHLKKKPAALVILSGTLLNRENWTTWSTSCKGLPFFQSHGANDALLSITAAEELEKILTAAGLEGSLYSFRGGHEIPMDVLKQLSSFLRKILG